MRAGARLAEDKAGPNIRGVTNPSMPVTETSEAEEMYLITVERAVERGEAEPVSTATIASELGVLSVSVNEMIKKMADRGLVRYEPYKGVSLTSDGREIASRVLRRRRLWGVFLSERLGVDPERADDIACDLEHVTPDDVADQLSAYLGRPARGPRGFAIPGSGG